MGWETALDLVIKLTAFGLSHVAEIAEREGVPDSVFRARHVAAMAKLDGEVVAMLARLRAPLNRAPENLP